MNILITIPGTPETILYFPGLNKEDAGALLQSISSGIVLKPTIGGHSSVTDNVVTSKICSYATVEIRTEFEDDPLIKPLLDQVRDEMGRQMQRSSAGLRDTLARAKGNGTEQTH